MTSRRGFLGSIATFAAACTLDPELALFVPGKKLISIPKPRGRGGNTLVTHLEIIRTKIYEISLFQNSERDYRIPFRGTVAPPSDRDYRIPFYSNVLSSLS